MFIDSCFVDTEVNNSFMKTWLSRLETMTSSIAQPPNHTTLYLSGIVQPEVLVTRTRREIPAKHI